MARACSALVGAALVLATVGLGLAAGGEEAISSGPAVGSLIGPFTVQDVTGPQKDKQLCYI